MKEGMDFSPYGGKRTLSSEDLQVLLTEGESQYVELKRRLPTDSLLARTLAAFANSEGGVLLVGIDERTTEVSTLGLSEEEADFTAKRLRAVSSALIPTPVLIGDIDIGGRKVVYASIDPVPPHLGPIATAEGRIYRRVADRDVNVPHRRVRVRRRSPRECRVFVAMSFRDEEEPSLVDYYEAMRRAASRTRLKLHVVRMDTIEGDYEISQQIMNEIDQADFVISDFTLGPSNVYFEVGYARGRNKRIVQTARRGTQLAFDVRSWRTILYRNATELEELLIPALTEAYDEWIGTQ